MRKLIILAVILTVVFVYSCNKEEQEVYSCDKELNEWAHKNVRVIRSMSREAWLQLDEQYKRPAFNALTPEQKLDFWKSKLTEVMTSFDWNDMEMEHLMKLYTYFVEHPDLYTEESLNDSVVNDQFARFCYRWKNDAMIDLDWTEEQIYAIAYTGNRMMNKDGGFQVVQKRRTLNLKESAPDETCNCNYAEENNCTRDLKCKEVQGCGFANRATCNGKRI